MNELSKETANYNTNEYWLFGLLKDINYIHSWPLKLYIGHVRYKVALMNTETIKHLAINKRLVGLVIFVYSTEYMPNATEPLWHKTVNTTPKNVCVAGRL